MIGYNSHIYKKIFCYIVRQLLVNDAGDKVWQNGKIDMGESRSENAFLRRTYFLSGLKGLFEEMIYGMSI